MSRTVPVDVLSALASVLEAVDASLSVIITRNARRFAYD